MRLGRVEVTGGFLLLLAWLNYLDRQTLVPLALVACAAHELGHWAVIRVLGGDISLVRLTAVGAEMVLKHALSYWQEGMAALAGPSVNMVLALVFCSIPQGEVFAGINLALACFNMIPVGRLDGGRALYSALALLIGEYWAGRIGRSLDLIFTALLLGLGTALAGLGGNITLFLVALWLFSVFICGNCGLQVGNRACHRSKKRLE